MPRPALLAVPVLLLSAAGAAWWWWTAPPRAPVVALAAAAAWAPVDAEAVIVVAQAPRLARWLARRRAALSLALVVMPAAASALQPLAPIAPSLMRTAQGPVVAWWGEPSFGLVAQVAPTDLEGLRSVSALQGLGWSEQGVDADTVRVWVFRGALGAQAGAPQDLPPPGEVAWAALARQSGQWWHIGLTRKALLAEFGVPPPLPECQEETIIVSRDLTLLLRPGFPVTAPGSLVITEEGQWGVRLNLEVSAEILTRTLPALGIRQQEDEGETFQIFNGPYGTLLVSHSNGIAIASDAATLERLPTLDPTGEWGCLKGQQVARALTGVATLVERLPGAVPNSDFRRAAASWQEVNACSWRSEAAGGRLLLKW